LSSLCNEVGGGFYQMDRSIRNVLLSELRIEPRFGESRLHDLADLLLMFVQRERSAGPNVDSASFLVALEWTALSFTQPADAAEALAIALSGELRGGEQFELMRIVNITQSLSDALVGHDQVVLYASGIDRLQSGDITAAARFFNGMVDSTRDISIGRARLPSP